MSSIHGVAVLPAYVDSEARILRAFGDGCCGHEHVIPLPDGQPVEKLSFHEFTCRPNNPYGPGRGVWLNVMDKTEYMRVQVLNEPTIQPRKHGRRR